MSKPRERETVEAFMTRALYDPAQGYYTRHVAGVGGRRADFSTVATIDEVLGAALGAWARSRLREAGLRAVIEVGGGNGALGKAVIRRLPWWPRVDYHVVEVSAPLRAVQQKALVGRRVWWHETIGSALAACGGRALIFSNELVDAFPCRQFERRDGVWEEVGVEWDGGRYVGEFRAKAALPEARMLNEAAREGQRVEVHEAYRRWLGTWAPSWREGWMLTIDYGYRLPPLPRLPWSGTLRAYFRQMRLEGEEIFRRVGRQDLTADVCFNDVQMWGEAAGWRTIRLEPQADWVKRWVRRGGVADDPDGAGNAFWVLEQRCGGPIGAKSGMV